MVIREADLTKASELKLKNKNAKKANNPTIKGSQNPAKCWLRAINKDGSSSKKRDELKDSAIAHKFNLEVNQESRKFRVFQDG